MKRIFATLFALAGALLSAATAWNFVGNQPADFSHNFPHADITPTGFVYTIPDGAYGTMRFNTSVVDSEKFRHLEIYSGTGRDMMFTFLAYGDGEGGYEKTRSTIGSFVKNDLFFPQRTILELGTNQRWTQGGISSFILTFSNSGKGSWATIKAVALRRGQDCLTNGALLLHTTGETPDAWEISDFASYIPDCYNGLPAIKVQGGTAKTHLNYFQREHIHRLSFYGEGVQSAQVTMSLRDGTPLPAVNFTETEPGFWQAEYEVPYDAFQGDFTITFAGEGQFGDVLLEDLGGKEGYHANWIWTPEGAKNNQEVYFRKEFVLDDPSQITGALLQATCDDAFTFEVNNNRIFNSSGWGNVQCAEVKQYFVKGKNVITADGRNSGGKAGFLAEVRMTKLDGSLDYLYTDGTWLTNTAVPGDNWRRIDPPEETKRDWKPAEELGKPPVQPWGSAVRYYTELPKAQERIALDKAAFAQRESSVRVGNLNGYPILEIDGEVTRPVIFGLRWKGDRTENYATAKASGFKVFRLVWEVAFEAWHSDGTIDYSGLEKDVEELLSVIPDAKILLMTRISSPSWWIAQHKDEAIVYADGLITGGDDGPFASPASEIWVNDATKMYAEAVAHVEQEWFANAIIGYMPCNLRGPEWVFPAKHNAFGDYSKPMLVHFRNFLREKYHGDVTELRNAWQNPAVTFDTAQIPTLALRQGSGGFFLDDNRQDVMDYNRALQQANTNAIMAFMDTIHENAPTKLAWLYYGYLMTLTHLYNHPASTGHYDVSRLLASGKVDVMASPVSYVWRRPGDISGCGSVEDSYRLHNVLWLQEADDRTFLTVADAHKNTFEPMASLFENRREFIYAALNRIGIWYYDLGGEWYDSPFFHEDFRRINELNREIWSQMPSWKPQAAFFFDEKCVDGLVMPNGDWGEMRPWRTAAEAQRSLAVSGVPYDIFELEDLYTMDVNQYQVFFFPNAWRNDPRLADFLQNQVYAKGKTAVFLYAPGFGQKGGIDAMQKLTGMTLREMPSGTPLEYTTLDNRVVGNFGMHQAEAFAIQDDQAEILGSYTADGSPAAATKQIGVGRSVLLPVQDPSGKTTREICRLAGLQPLDDKFDRVVYDGNYLGVIPIDGPGPRTFTLPLTHYTTAVECFTGREFPVTDGTFTIDNMAPGEAWLFQLK